MRSPAVMRPPRVLATCITLCKSEAETVMALEGRAASWSATMTRFVPSCTETRTPEAKLPPGRQPRREPSMECHHAGTVETSRRTPVPVEALMLRVRAVERAMADPNLVNVVGAPIT